MYNKWWRTRNPTKITLKRSELYFNLKVKGKNNYFLGSLTPPNVQEFEKDDDSNFHIDLLYSLSNLRCRAYKLSELTWLETKIKAGRIIPALATTTTSIAAL